MILEMNEEKDEYIEKLSKKNPMQMKRFELEDWLDYIIYDKMKYHTMNQVQKDTFNHLLHYFRLLHFEIHMISAKADNNSFLLKSLLLVLKENNPKLVDVVLDMTQDMVDKKNKELIKDETPEDAQHIMDRAEEFRKEYKVDLKND